MGCENLSAVLCTCSLIFTGVISSLMGINGAQNKKHSFACFFFS